MFFLKEDTAADIKLGPFVDKSDGVTYETGMAAAMDNATTGVRLSKNGGAFADRNEGTEPAYDAFGYYLVKLSTTDTNTPGTLKVIFGDAAVCLPCEANFQVVAANVYDSLFGAAGTDLLDVSTVQLAGTACTGRDIGASVLLSSGTGTGQLDFTSGVVKANLAQILGTALTETSGLIAAAFKKFFNVATPTGTVNSLPDAVAGAAGGVFIAGTNAATTVTTALTTTFTGNLTGSVASVANIAPTGTGLSAIPWNAAWDAEVQSEVTDALAAHDPSAMVLP